MLSWLVKWQQRRLTCYLAIRGGICSYTPQIRDTLLEFTWIEVITSTTSKRQIMYNYAAILRLDINRKELNKVDFDNTNIRPNFMLCFLRKWNRDAKSLLITPNSHRISVFLMLSLRGLWIKRRLVMSSCAVNGYKTTVRKDNTKYLLCSSFYTP